MSRFSIYHTVRIAYLIPEFPGQTHIFLWREMQEMAKRGYEIELISTRRPLASIVSHEWAKDAGARTTYLFPLKVGSALGALVELIRSGPGAWWRSIKAVLSARDVHGAPNPRVSGTRKFFRASF